ncbi:unnamed protein product, partial [Chrysoparadoxa australica]
AASDDEQGEQQNQVQTGRKKQRFSISSKLNPDPYSEGLGDDYMMTAWKRPSPDIATKLKHERQFMEGRAPLCGTT